MAYQQSPYDARICRDCLEEFTLSVREVAVFSQPNHTLPVRCRDCRAARRSKREQQQAERAGLHAGGR